MNIIKKKEEIQLHINENFINIHFDVSKLY